MLTICCTGAHLLPNTGKEKRLPTTATAHRTPATASFFTFVFFISITPLIVRKRLYGSDASKIGAKSRRDFARKIGRCLLASSHAGTRLPIAALQDSGRSPSVRHF